MSILSIDDLQQKVDADLIWRKKELSNIRLVILENENNLQMQPTFLRAGVAVLYAHWEGFIKKTGSYYLEFVSNQRKKSSELTDNFIGIKIKSLLKEAAKSNKVSSMNDITVYFLTKLNNRLRIPLKGVIDTQSNLSSSVLKEIIYILGLDNTPFEKEEEKETIDNKLVNRRNHIAHGETLEISMNDYFKLHTDVMILIEEFRNQVQNAAATSRFLR